MISIAALYQVVGSVVVSLLFYYAWYSRLRPIESRQPHGGPALLDTENLQSKSIQTPVIQLPRLYPLFPEDGSKGDTTVDIIAVHGLETTSPKTWVAYERDTEPKGSPTYWLKDSHMLPSVVAGARTWAFDYNSNYSRHAQIVPLSGLATALLYSIIDKFDDFGSRPIVFIGSCFGGIVVAEALLKASRETDDEKKRAIFEQTAGVIFLGSPLRGTTAATLAWYENYVSGVLGRNQEASNTLIDDLQKHSSRLESLVEEFGELTRQSQTRKGMEIRCFYETRTTQVWNKVSRLQWVPKPKEVILVNRLSACLDCHERIPLEVRHSMMNKYRGTTDPSFKLVAGRIKDIVEKIRADDSLTGEEQMCMRALSFDYRNQKDVNPQRVTGTCEWFLRHPKFLEWRRDTAANLLWVTADPGCGKSVLSRALVDSSLLDPDEPDAVTNSTCYFFFKDDAERGSGRNALRSLLHQLFKQKPWLIRHAVREYQTTQELTFEQLWDVLMRAVSDTNAGPVICLLDALDECESSTRRSLIQHISAFYTQKMNSKLKFIVMSRPYHHIEADFGIKIDNLPSIHLDGDEKSEDICREIDIVIDQEVTNICRARRPKLDAKIQTSLTGHLKNRKGRTYLWVHLMLEELRMSLESSERKLTNLLNALPESVYDAYNKILSRATEPVQARRVLNLVLGAERPLTWKEMNIALELLDKEQNGERFLSKEDMELDMEEAFRAKIRNLCGLFISIVDEKIYLIHQTAKEFLLCKIGDANTWSLSSWKHSFTPVASSQEVLNACLAYLQLFESESEELHDAPYSRVVDLIERHSFLEYASAHWIFHFQQVMDEVDEAIVYNAIHFCNIESWSVSLWFQVYQEQNRFSVHPTDNAVLLSSSLGLTTAVELLMNTETTFDTADRKYRLTPLSWAAKYGHVPILKLLVKKGAGVNSKDRSDMTPLMWAAKNGCLAGVELLIENGADIDSIDATRKTALHWAAPGHYDLTLKMSLAKGGFINLSKDDAWTPGLAAGAFSHEATMKLLIKRGAEVDSRDEEGRTSLLYAAESGNETAVNLLIKRGAEVDSRDDEGLTSLFYAAESGNETAVNLLIERGAEVDSRDDEGWTSLLYAAESGNETAVDLLIERGAEVDSRDNQGRTSLSNAAASGNEMAVKILIEKGAEVDSRDNYGQTPLKRAVDTWQSLTAKLLVEKGADINWTDGEGDSLLFWAVKGGDESLLELLVEKGADIELKDAYSHTALWKAAELGDVVMVRLLIEIGADINSQDCDGRTPLHVASLEECESVVKLLVQKGADVNLTDDFELTPLNLAAGWGHESIAKLLESSAQVC